MKDFIEIDLDAVSGYPQQQVWHNFDAFNNLFKQYWNDVNPKLKKIYLHCKNYRTSKFDIFAKGIFDNYSRQRNVYAEHRITIKGKSKDEWHNFAQCMVYKRMLTHKHVRWMIQLPRRESATTEN